MTDGSFFVVGDARGARSANPRKITEFGDDGPLPDTRKMTVYGRIDGRVMSLTDPVDGSHGGNCGMSSGYHFRNADPLRPMHFPHDLPVVRQAGGALAAGGTCDGQ